MLTTLFRNFLISVFILAVIGGSMPVVSVSSETSRAAAAALQPGDKEAKAQAARADAKPKPADLSELRRKYSETFKFRGPEVKQVALTFDDGPDPRFTPQILNILQKEGVKATFFIVGNRAKKFPALVKRIRWEGHLIGNHSFGHPNFGKRSLKQFQTEILRTEKIIQQTAGYRPKLIRPPYGEIREPQIKWAKQNGYTIVNWNVDSLDWKGLNKSKVENNVLGAIEPGSIVLFHAGGGVGSNLNGTIQALPDIIQTLRDKGYQFVDLAELLNTAKYR